MKSIIAAALSVLIGAFGYVVVDAEIENRVTTLESQVASLEAEIEKYHSATEPETEETTTVVYEDDGEMIWPVEGNAVVVEGYPAYSSGNPHSGIDIFIHDREGNGYDSKGNSLSYRSPIHASQSGVVVEAYNNGEWNTGYGNYCVVDHGNGIQTLYAHADVIYVSEGDTVEKGQTLGLIGKTGNATAPHLHFEVRTVNDDGTIQRVDPLDYVSEP